MITSKRTNINNSAFLSSFLNLLLKYSSELVSKRTKWKTVNIDQIDNLTNLQVLVVVEHIHSGIVYHDRKIVFPQLRKHLIYVLFLTLCSQISNHVFNLDWRVFIFDLFLSVFQFWLSASKEYNIHALFCQFAGQLPPNS